MPHTCLKFLAFFSSLLIIDILLDLSFLTHHEWFYYNYHCNVFVQQLLNSCYAALALKFNFNILIFKFNIF